MATPNLRKSSRTLTVNQERGRSAVDLDGSLIKPSYPIHRYRSTKAIPELSSTERQELKVSVYALYYVRVYLHLSQNYIAKIKPNLDLRRSFASYSPQEKGIWTAKVRNSAF